MNQQEKKSFPIIAALLTSKALKQISTGDSRDPMPSFVIRGHETMSVTLHIQATKPGFWIECEADCIEDGIVTEACALVAFFALTWESTREYALDELRKMLPQFADKFSSSFFA